MLPEHSYAVVTRDVPAEKVCTGDVGVIVHIHQNEAGEAIGYLLELFTPDGESLDVVSVPADAVRALGPNDRAAVRVAAE
jgi:hypothetical protein